MKLTILQTAPAWRHAAQSIDEAERLLANVGETDLMALPEMWPTGFDAAPDGETQRGAEMALRWMERTAHERDCAVVGSVAWREAGETVWRNRCLFVTPAGIVAHYDKAHLFTPADEHLRFRPGEESPFVEWRGFRFRTQTCFDLRFTEGARNRAGAPYDVLFYGASWPVQRRAAWAALLRARAIENQAYCLGVNRTGTDPYCTYNGGSLLVAPTGEAFGPLDSLPQTCTFEISREAILRARQRFSTLLPAADE